MKKVLENIKTNKLRSALIGCCAFLFGFISVSIYNNIGDTYAIKYMCPTGYSAPNSSHPDKCCPTGWNLVDLTDSGDGYYCRATINSVSKEDCNNKYNGTWHGGATPRFCELPYEDGTPMSDNYTASFRLNGGKSWISNGGYYIREGVVIATCEPKTTTGNCIVTSPVPEPKNSQLKFIGYSENVNPENGECEASSIIPGSTNYVRISKNTPLYACYTSSTQKPSEGNGSGGSQGGSGASGTTDSGTKYVVANTKNYYAIKYDLNGGHFIDGSTERTEYAVGSNALGNMKTNPIKNGHVFIEWQYNGKAFDFSKPLDELGVTYTDQSDEYIDITLKAVYEQYTDDTLYCKNNAELDYATGKCYTVLKEDSSKNIYTHTTYLYDYANNTEGKNDGKNERFCYAYNDLSTGDKTPGGIYFREETTVSYTPSGKQDAKYSGYEGNDYWISKETCKIGAPCYVTTQSTDYPAETCEVTYSTIIYHEEDALVKETIDVPTDESDTPSDGDEGIPNDGVGGGNEEEPDDTPIDDKPSNDKTDEELKENEKTGDVLIILAWVVGLCALGYTAYYFIKRKREN